jgi:hypothetical protein
LFPNALTDVILYNDSGKHIEGTFSARKAVMAEEGSVEMSC